MKNKIIICFCLIMPMLAASQGIDALKVDSLVTKFQTMEGVIVVNFWSTWCKPCVEEIPHFISITDSYKTKGVHLLLVSQDSRQLYETGKLAAFLQLKKWDVPVVWLQETNADYYCPKVDSSWQGGIPSTLIINPQKKYRKFFEESLTAEKLEAEIKKAL